MVHSDTIICATMKSDQSSQDSYAFILSLYARRYSAPVAILFPKKVDLVFHEQRKKA